MGKEDNGSAIHFIIIPVICILALGGKYLVSCHEVYRLSEEMDAVANSNMAIPESKKHAAEVWKNHEGGWLTLVTGDLILNATNSLVGHIPYLSEVVRNHLTQNPTTNLLVVMSSEIESNRDGLLDRRAHYRYEEWAIKTMLSNTNLDLHDRAVVGASVDFMKLQRLLRQNFSKVERVYMLREFTDDGGENAAVVFCIFCKDNYYSQSKVVLYDTAKGKVIRTTYKRRR